jgi:uncharacterized protein with HEPN domain
MSKRSDLVYLGTVLDAARRAEVAAAEVTRERFDTDVLAQLALAFVVQNVGEAAAKVPAELRAQHANIPWHAIIGMRHRIVHDYLNVQIDVVWDAVQRDIPALIAALLKIIPADPPE